MVEKLGMRVWDLEFGVWGLELLSGSWDLVSAHAATCATASPSGISRWQIGQRNGACPCV